jgi:regulator of vacuolar morphogenesis
MMPDKRKASMSEPSNKRLRISNEDASDTASSTSTQTQERPRNNPVYGQKSAFPGLDDGGDELFYGSADDGIEYLRMVR